MRREFAPGLTIEEENDGAVEIIRKGETILFRQTRTHHIHDGSYRKRVETPSDVKFGGFVVAFNKEQKFEGVVIKVEGVDAILVPSDDDVRVHAVAPCLDEDTGDLCGFDMIMNPADILANEAIDRALSGAENIPETC